jgi:hypothetical protein
MVIYSSSQQLKYLPSNFSKCLSKTYLYKNQRNLDEIKQRKRQIQRKYNNQLKEYNHSVYKQIMF